MDLAHETARNLKKNQNKIGLPGQAIEKDNLNYWMTLL